jgi:hypothetical protein
MKGFLERILQNENNIKIIGGIHLATACFFSIYGLLFKKSRFDIIYVFYTLFLLISWTCFNGGCILSEFIKKKNNKEYIFGQDSKNLDDMIEFMGSPTMVYIIIVIMNIFHAISTFIILKRNDFPIYIYGSLPLMHILYILSIKINNDLCGNEFFLTLQEGFKFAFVIILTYIFGKQFHLVKN